MVFSGADLSAIFAAADANDQTLTKDIWSARGGDQFVTYAQCRRRYNAFKKARDEGDGEEEDAGAATPVAEKRHSRTDPPASTRMGASTQAEVRDTPHQAEVRIANAARRRNVYAEVSMPRPRSLAGGHCARKSCGLPRPLKFVLSAW